MATTNTNPPKSRKDAFRERLSINRPDLNFDDEESFYGALNEDYDNFDNERNRYNENIKAANELFNKDERGAAFVGALADGKDGVVELVRLYGPEFIEALNDPDKQEALAEANADYAARNGKSKEMQASFDENDPVSREALAAAGISDEDFKRFCTFIADTVENMLVGKYDADVVKTVLNGMNHEALMKEAEDRGRIDGANSKIKEQRRQRGRGDGLPMAGGGGGGDIVAEEPEPEAPKPDLGALGEMGTRSAWGNAKRVDRR